MADNFNMKQFLAENKLGAYSKLKEEKFYAPSYVAKKYGSKAKEIEDNIEDEKDNNPNIWDLYTSLETEKETDEFVKGFMNEDETVEEGDDEDKLPLTPKMKKFIDKVISDAKKDGEFEELVQVDYFQNELIDFILEKFDEESDYDDVSQEVKDYINKSVKDYYRNPDGTPYFSEDLNEDSDENYDIFMDGVLDVLVKDKLITKADVDALNRGGADDLMDALHDEWEGFKNYEETGQAISRSDLNLAARAVAKKIGKLKEDYAGAEEEKMMDFLAEKDKKEEGYMGTQYDSSEDMAVDMVKKGITEKISPEAIERMEGLADEESLAKLNIAITLLGDDWMKEGFEKEDILEYLEHLLNTKLGEAKKPMKEGEDIFADIEDDLMHGSDSKRDQIEYLQEVIDWCQNKIDEIKDTNMDEAIGGKNPEGDKLVLRFLQGVAKKFNYPVAKAAIFVKDTIKSLGY